MGGNDEIINTNDLEEFRVDSNDGHQYVESPVTRNYGWEKLFAEVNDVKNNLIRKFQMVVTITFLGRKLI